jgi:hypothetical protein
VGDAGFEASEQAKGRYQDAHARRSATSDAVAGDDEFTQVSDFTDYNKIRKALEESSFCIVQVWDELMQAFNRGVNGSTLCPVLKQKVKDAISAKVTSDTADIGESTDTLEARHEGRCALLVMTITGRTLRCSNCP